MKLKLIVVIKLIFQQEIAYISYVAREKEDSVDWKLIVYTLSDIFRLKNNSEEISTTD